MARAAAEATGQPLWRYIGGVNAHVLPTPMMNILNGGAHADNALDVQEVMVVPTGAGSFAEAVRAGAEVFHALKGLLGDAGLSTAVGDEGGFAPAIDTTADALGFVMKAVEMTGRKPGEDVVLALDAAASELLDGGKYNLAGEGRSLAEKELCGYWSELASEYPIASIEDPLGEDSWTGFAGLTAAMGKDVQIVGDDLFATNPERLARGIADGAGNAVLVKVNQIGTLTEALEAVSMAKEAGFGVVVSHRSGETEDSFIADLAVATNAGQIKAGSLSRSDRLAKYNQLLRIEEELGGAGAYHGRLRG